ncbi:MAG: hypothetical protein K0Q74_61 [Gammaproteobacteria bacterium]|jgi:nicotinate-nucleotide pyrophosphorylase (carboxylating)|nr:hypothetical protein [Gammaproteobacteria bacterium]
MKITELNETLLNISLQEDLGENFCDITTDLLFPKDKIQGTAHIISKHHEPIVVCGIEWTRFLFSKLSEDARIESDRSDGDLLMPGERLLSVTADAKTLLKGERTALNFLRHLCAISTLTKKYVDKISMYDLKILDTRKTTPGFRLLEKYAVHCGGGMNHRMGLYDAVMIKDTHVDLLGDMEKTLIELPCLNQHTLPVIVEVRSQEELHIVLEHGQAKVHRVLLDNMSLEDMSACVKACQGIFETEASGNIRLDRIVDIAKTGVNYASVGELTYGAGHVDLSMKAWQESV